VFDWNRVGLDGKPRELHVAESLASIDFADFEPGLVPKVTLGDAQLKHQRLVHDALFEIDEYQTGAGVEIEFVPDTPQVIAAVKGGLLVNGHSVEVSLSPGEFCLIPACEKNVSLHAEGGSVFLRAAPTG
jgi:mannose-6-phosphate isomerase